MIDYEQKLRNVITHFCETPKSFADLMGVSPQVVSNWLARGIKNIDTLQDILAKLPNLNAAYFFEEGAEMERSTPSQCDASLREENQLLREEIIALHLELAQLRKQSAQKVAG